MAERKTRLLVLGCKSPPETFLDRLFQGLEERGVEITLASTSARSPKRDRNRNSSWIWSPRPAGNPFEQGVQLAVVAAAAAARDFRETTRSLCKRVPGRSIAALQADLISSLPLVGRQFDVLYFPWVSSAASVLPTLSPDVRVIVSCRGSQINVAPQNPRRASLRDSLRAVFERATLVHCVSERIRAEAMKLGMPESKARVVRPAVDPTHFEYRLPGATTTQGTLRIISTGNIVGLKGFEYLVHSVSLLRATGVDARLEIIGDGPERARVLYTAHDLGIEDAVQLLGTLPPEQVRERLQQSDVFVLASLSEGISNAVLEGMSCGLPIVTTDCGGMREAVTDGVEGCVVPSRNPQAMAQALAKLSADAELRRAMGAAARARVEREFTLSRQIDAWTALLSEAVA